MHMSDYLVLTLKPGLHWDVYERSIKWMGIFLEGGMYVQYIHPYMLYAVLIFGQMFPGENDELF